MDAVTSGAEGNAWLPHIQIGDQETLFKLDTGAEVTATGEATTSPSWQTTLWPLPATLTCAGTIPGKTHS